MSQVVTRLARGAADAIKAPRLTAHGVLEVSTKRQVFPKVAVGITPVAGGHHTAGGIEYIDSPAAAAAVQAFEVLIDGDPVLRARVGQQLRNAGLQFQQAGQVSVFAQLTFDGTGMQFKLAFAGFAEGADAEMFADAIAGVTQANRQQDDQQRQQKVTEQTRFHGK